MLLALAVALLMGGALGWLVHRFTHKRYADSLQQAMARQNQQLQQAQNDVALINDDYEELNERAQSEISALKQENKQIPFLNNNLEKSQLLVRQMIQKHDVQQRDLQSKNQKLAAKIKQLEEREHMKNTVAAEIDSMRRERASQTAPIQQEHIEVDDAAVDAGTGTGPGAGTSSDTGTDTCADTRTDTGISTGTGTDSGTGTDAGAESMSASFVTPPPSANALERDTSEPRFVAAEAPEDPFDEVMEVGDDLKIAIDAPIQNNDHPDSGESFTTSEQAPLEFETDSADQPSDRHAILDGSVDSSTLFEPVNQQDDLQQIFGIGPVTEKALNQLGITSYSQLADLKHHEIQKIADALEIVPGRIERDNWVGSARRQLEEVLEQL
jgi:predicted flap endonuclease-1-like 5' DNA nuclease